MKKILIFLFFLLLFLPLFSFCQDLSIYQLSYDGTDEWISIKNNGTESFSGSLTISGAKSASFIIDANIGSGEIYYITDSLQLTGAQCNYQSGQGLSLSDTKEISIELLYGSGSLGSYIIPEEVVTFYNNKNTVLEFVGSQRTGSTQLFTSGSCVLKETIESSGDPPVINSSGSIIQIEGIYPLDDELYTEHIWFSSIENYSGVLLFEGLGQGSSVKELQVDIQSNTIYSISDNEELGSSFTTPSISLTNGGEDIVIKNLSGNTLGFFTYTGVVGVSPLDGLTNTGTIDIDTPEDTMVVQLSGLSISEIQPYSDGWGEYIEIFCESMCIGEIFIQGIARGEIIKNIHISLGSGELLVITGGNTMYPGYIKNIPISGFSLKDTGGEIYITGQGGQLIDTKVYSGGIRGKSFNKDENGLFTLLEKQTPGIDKEYFINEEIIENEITSCEIGIQNKTPLFFPQKINPIVVLGGKNLSNSNKSYRCEWIMNDLYTGILENCNPGYGGFEESGIHALEVIVYKDDEKICTTKNMINYPQEEEREPNRTNYYKGLYNKRKDKYTALKKDLSAVGITINGSGSLQLPGEEDSEQLYASGIVIVSSIVPNPSGSDIGNERITLKNTTKKLLTFGKIYSKKGTQKKLIVDSLRLGPYEEKEFTGSFGLLNKASCIDLYTNGLIYDTFCYTQAKDDEVKIRLEKTLEEKGTEAILDSGKYGLDVFSGSVCLTYDALSLSCKPLPYNTEDVKIYKKQARKLSTVQKKLDEMFISKEKQSKKYKKLREKYTTLENTLSLLKKEHKKHIQVRNDLIYYRKNKLQSDRNTIYSSNGFSDSYNGYTFLLEKKTGGMLGSLKIDSIKEYVSFTEGTLLLESYDIQKEYGYLMNKTKKLYTTFLENLSAK